MVFGTTASLFDAARAQANQISTQLAQEKAGDDAKGDTILGTLPVSAELAKYIADKTGVTDALKSSGRDAIEQLKSTIRGPQPSAPPEPPTAEQQAQRALGNTEEGPPAEELELQEMSGLRGSEPNSLSVQHTFDNPLFEGGDVAADTTADAAGTTAGDIAGTVATDVGIDAGVAADEAVGGALDATGILAPLGATLGVLGALGGLGAQLGEGLKDILHHPSKPLQSFAESLPPSVVAG